MKVVTNILSSGVHEIEGDGQTEKIQFVPQIVSTLRLDLVFWSNLPAERSIDQLSDHQVTINDRKLGLIEIKISGFFGQIIPLNQITQDPRTP